ncbi:MAG: hypothetical protein SFV15_00725 [Polyangiaceae bacterium]|nr:hypothetical protein [Polyangiaceae bacterium]
MSQLSAPEILVLFKELNAELERSDTRAEICVLGGAVMCLVFAARAATQVDAYFRPSAAVREAAHRVAIARGLPEDWLNDAAKGFLSERGQFTPFLELSKLSVLTATPEYLLAMKCLAMRLGAEFHDEADIRFLLRYLNITEPKAAHEILARYYPLDRFPPKTFFALEEMLEVPG